jgi:hypothetical protein
LWTRLGQGQQLVQLVKIPPLPVVELGHGNKPPSRILRTAYLGIWIAGELAVFDAWEGHIHELAFNPTGRRFWRELVNHPNVGMLFVHGRHSLAAILTQSQSLASVTLLTARMMINVKSLQDENSTIATTTQFRCLLRNAIAHLHVVAVEMQAFPVLEAEFWPFGFVKTMCDQLPCSAVEGKQVEVEIARMIIPLLSHNIKQNQNVYVTQCARR